MLGALVAKELRESVQSVVGFHNSVVRAKATSPLVQGPGQRGKDPTEERILQEAVEVDKAGAAQSARLQEPSDDAAVTAEDLANEASRKASQADEAHGQARSYHEQAQALLERAREKLKEAGGAARHLLEAAEQAIKDAAQRLHLIGQKVEPQGKRQEPVAAPSGPSQTGSQPSGAAGPAENVGPPEAEGGTGHTIQGLLHQFGEKMGLVHHGEKSHQGTVKTVQS